MYSIVLKCKKVIFLFSLSFLITQNFYSQCFEIESILVDACGSVEGENEMVRFSVGNTALNTANLNVSWANTVNPWLGICQNATTANAVTALNTTICGWLKEPTGGVLPSNAQVLLITSTTIDLNANSFANLSDTLYVIFQCAGNTAGHFANWSTTPGLRTLTMSFSSPSGCSDVVTYDRTLLLNQNGLIGGSAAIRDGALANFDNPGNVTYANFGCQAPFIPGNVTISALSLTTICPGNTIQLFTSSSSSITNLSWTGNNGSFNSTTNDTVTYTSSVNDTSNFYIIVEGTSACGTVKDSVLITVNQQITTNQNFNECQGFSVTVGSNNYNTTGTFIDTLTSITTGCDSIVTTNLTIKQSLTTAQNFNECQGFSVTVGSNNYNTTGTFIDTLTSITTGCDSIVTTNLTINQPISVQIIENDTVICQNDLINGFVLHATGGINLSWNTGQLNIDSLLVNQEGIYTVTSNNNGCVITDNIQITIDDCIEPTIFIPNVFTPNNDGLNDFFMIEGSFIENFEATIFNRWGKEIYNWKDINEGWDGKYKGTLVVDGTYIYLIEVVFSNKEKRSLTGTVMLLK